MSTGDLPPYWPASGQAAAYLERVQNLLTARGLTGSERRLKPLMRKVTEAFRAQDLAGVTAACDAVVDVIEREDEPPTLPQNPVSEKGKK